MISLKRKSLERGADSRGLTSHFTRILQEDEQLRTMLTYKMSSNHWLTVKKLKRVQFVSYRRIIDFGKNFAQNFHFL